MKNTLIGLLAVCLLPMAATADIHKCIVNGKTVYTDKACPDEQAAVEFEPEALNSTAAEKVSYTGNRWMEDRNGYLVATEESKKTNIPVLIYVYTDWCPYCKKLESIYFADKSVDTTLARFIKVKLNPDDSRENKQLFESWGGRGYPTVFVQYPDQSPTKVALPSMKKPPFTNPRDFNLMLARYLPLTQKQ